MFGRIESRNHQFDVRYTRDDFIQVIVFSFKTLPNVSARLFSKSETSLIDRNVDDDYLLPTDLEMPPGNKNDI